MSAHTGRETTGHRLALVPKGWAEVWWNTDAARSPEGDPTIVAWAGPILKETAHEVVLSIADEPMTFAKFPHVRIRRGGDAA